MDTAGVRSETLQIITIATLMVGFGLFSISFQPEVDVVGYALQSFRGIPVEPLFEIQPDIVLSLLTASLGVFIMLHYIGMLWEARGLFVRTSLPIGEIAGRQEIVERQGSLLGMLVVLAGETFLLFVTQQLARAVSS